MTQQVRALLAVAALLSLAPSSASAVVTSTPIAAACTTVARGCRVQLDPFALQPALGRRLERFSFELDGQPVYDFAWDQSNPPSAAYVPSAPANGLAARCEQSYVVTVRAMDDLDASPVLVGQTDAVTCPVRVPDPGSQPGAFAAAAALFALRRRAIAIDPESRCRRRCSRCRELVAKSDPSAPTAETSTSSRAPWFESRRAHHRATNRIRLAH